MLTEFLLFHNKSNQNVVLMKIQVDQDRVVAHSNRSRMLDCESHNTMAANHLCQVLVCSVDEISSAAEMVGVVAAERMIRQLIDGSIFDLSACLMNSLCKRIITGKDFSE